jgi:predicted enzyme related to lactoylglutathione lyase
MKTRLIHVRANVSDLYKSIAWYEKTLGFECKVIDVNERWAYADFECGEGATFAIMESKNGNSSARFNFSVDNVDELWECLKDKVTIVEAIETLSYGSRKFTISDIDGNELGFVQSIWGK